jgi:hypothetical protein
MRTKKVKPPPKEFEYLLIITKEHDILMKKDYISFKFRTTKEFLTFKYILNIEALVTGNNIMFDIVGFKAPTGDLSAHGFAGFEYRFYEFKYTAYSVLINRKDVDSVRFKFKVLRSKSNPIKPGILPRKSFIKIVTHNETQTV